jgi:hypothetical protein
MNSDQVIDIDAFTTFKETHPDFFPDGTPIEKQHAYFKTITETKAKQLSEKVSAFHKQDENTVNAQREREIIKDAKTIYESGKFIEYCNNQFRKIWVSDEHILKSILYQAAEFKLLNPDEGIHLNVTGITQIGKSDSVKTALKFIPKDYRLIRTFSPKWIFHANDVQKDTLHKNQIIFSDDTQLDPEVAGIYRNILTSWHEGVTRGTVINNKPVDLDVPQHISLILTSVNDVVAKSDEGQDESRFLQVEVRRTAELDKEIREFIQNDIPDISKELSLIHKIWDIMPEKKVLLHKKVDRKCTIREFKRFMTLVKCNALLKNKNVTTDEDFSDIEAFLTYSKPMIDAQTPARKRDEEVVKQVLTSSWKNTDTIQEETKLPPQRVYRALHGRDGTFNKPDGGLMQTERGLLMEYNPDTRKYSFRMLFTM